MIDHDPPDWTRLDALDSYWDDVAAIGPGQARLSALDDGLAAAVRQLHVADGAPVPDPAFAERLWQELLRSAAPAAGVAGAPAQRTGIGAARASGLPHRRRLGALLAVAAVLLAALLVAVVGVYPWAPPPVTVSANAREIVRRSVIATSMRGAIQSFALTERVIRRPGNSGLPLFDGYRGTVETLVARWYEAPSRWRIERRYGAEPRGTLAREYDAPGVRVGDGKVFWDYLESGRTVQIQNFAGQSGTADLFPLGEGDAAPPPGQTPRGLGDVVREATGCYTPTVQADDRVAGRDTFVVDLERSGCYSASAHEIDGRLTLWVDKQTFFVLKSVLYDVADRARPYITTEVTRVRYNIPIDRTLFTFTPPLGATILDGRARAAHRSDATDPRAVAVARKADFPLFIVGETLAGLPLQPPSLDARGAAHLAYGPSSVPLDVRRSVQVVERRATAVDVASTPPGAAPVLVDGGLDTISGWYRETGGGRFVSLVRGGTRVDLASALLPKDNLVALAGSLTPVAGGKPLGSDPPVRGLSALRRRVPFPIFVPTYVPGGLVPREPALGTGGSLITITYDTPDGTAAVSVGNGPAGCCIDQDARKGQDRIVLPGGAVAHFMPNEPQFGGPILWLDEGGTYVAISGPSLTRGEEVKIAASLSRTASLRAG